MFDFQQNIKIASKRLLARESCKISIDLCSAHYSIVELNHEQMDKPFLKELVIGVPSGRWYPQPQCRSVLMNIVTNWIMLYVYAWLVAAVLCHLCTFSNVHASSSGSDASDNNECMQRASNGRR